MKQCASADSAVHLPSVIAKLAVMHPAIATRRTIDQTEGT